jgi:redox-sensing transcriptional repressor
MLSHGEREGGPSLRVVGMKKVSESTVARLSIYLRLLHELDTEGVQTLSSEELARRCGTTAAQVRKDLSFFGTFGKRGLGYGVPELIAALRSILGLERRWRVALIGAGKIGVALLGYQDFRRQGFYITAVFDADAGKIGQRWHDLEIRADAEMESALRTESIDIAIVAVPAESAQPVVNRIVASGVRAILNFAPTKLTVPAGVALKNVNMAVELEGLSYALANGTRAGRGSRRNRASSLQGSVQRNGAGQSRN